jgi:hypothetical protein
MHLWRLAFNGVDQPGTRDKDFDELNCPIYVCRPQRMVVELEGSGLVLWRHFDSTLLSKADDFNRSK